MAHSAATIPYWIGQVMAPAASSAAWCECVCAAHDYYEYSVCRQLAGQYPFGGRMYGTADE